MTTTELAGPVANYIAAANDHDIDAMVAAFNEDAVVRDEGKERQGIAAIRQWAAEVTGSTMGADDSGIRTLPVLWIDRRGSAGPCCA